MVIIFRYAKVSPPFKLFEKVNNDPEFTIKTHRTRKELANSRQSRCAIFCTPGKLKACAGVHTFFP